ncbi:TPM domain-containing protein [Breznakiellaceae bacterium SP9]
MNKPDEKTLNKVDKAARAVSLVTRIVPILIFLVMLLPFVYMFRNSIANDTPFAESRADFQDRYVFDNAHQLKDSEKNALEERITAIKRSYNFNVVIATERSIGGEDIETYGDGFYEKSGFGSEPPGVLLFLVTGDTQYYVNTYGESPYSDLVNDNYERDFLQYLIADPTVAYNAFLDDVENTLKTAYTLTYVNDRAHRMTNSRSNGGYVIDNAKRLKDREKSVLEERLAAIKSAYNFNVVLVTEESEETARHANDYYYNAFSVEYDAPGVLLMWELDSGWYIQTYGEGPMGGWHILNKDALTEAGQEYLVGSLLSDPYKAYSAFIDDVEKYLKLAATEKIYVNDGSHLLTDEQVRTLNDRIAAIKSAYDFDVVLVTEETIHGWEPMVYADDFFDYRGGGFGNGENGGVLMLWVTDIRWAWFSGYGQSPLGGETVFNDFTIAASDKHIDKYLKADEGGVDDIYGMYMRFLDDVELYLGLAAQGRSYNFLYEYLHVFLITAWALALLVALIMVSVWKKGMNTAKGSGEAAAYIVPGSLQFAAKTDTFLYSTVSKTAKASSSSGGSRSSGGSHRSSSGRSHSGGGGRH